MGNLKKRLHKNEKAIKNREKDKPMEIPVYDMFGKSVTPGKDEKIKRQKQILIIIGIILCFIYVPQIFMSSNSTPDNDLIVTPNSSAIQLNNAVLREYPTGDFDGDGLDNAAETNLGTNLWESDTDQDGISDYYEVSVSYTDPLEEDDLLLKTQKKVDKANDKAMSSPYKIGNVILWASDYESKAYGSVIETLTGYQVYGFDGYMQFPGENIYAYKLKDGTRTLLDYREKEQVWEVSAGDYIEIYDEKLEEVVELKLFAPCFYLKNNAISNLLVSILPENGFITAEQKTLMDVEPDTREGVTLTPKAISYDEQDATRLMVNATTLNDLQYVRETIGEEEKCVLVSLYNDEIGEYVGVIYGYTYEGDLLVADASTLEPIGKLTIYESSKKTLDNTGNIAIKNYFHFMGLGFSSFYGDRISFFADEESSNYLAEDYAQQ